MLRKVLVQVEDNIFYWSRIPGKFVNKRTGKAIDLSNSLSPGPQFTGSVAEWYETLIETTIDCVNTAHRNHGPGFDRGNCRIRANPDVLCIYETSVTFKPSAIGNLVCGFLITNDEQLYEEIIIENNDGIVGKIIVLALPPR